MGSVTAGQTIVQEIAVVAGQRVKVVVAWNSRSDGTTDRLMADLDLRVFDADGSVDSSLTFDNNYEWVEFIAGATGTARIEVRQARPTIPSMSAPGLVNGQYGAYPGMFCGMI